MRIQLLSTGLFPYSIGGIQKHSSLLLEHFRSQKAEVELFHCGEHQEDPTPPNFSESVKYLPFPNSLVPFPGHYVYESWKYSAWIAKQLATSPTGDIIYAQGFSAWAWLDQRKKTQQQTPVIVNFHGLEMFQPPPNTRQALNAAMFRPFVRRIIRKADYVQSLGGHLTDILVKEGVSKNKILTIPIGIDSDWVVDSLPQHQSPLTFVFVGRYERRKGIQEIIQAIELLPKELDFRFEFIGEILESSQSDDPRLTFHGLIKSGDRVKEILKQSDVLVCPSYSEGLPTVILEAMARGCAIVYTDVGAVREAADEHVGWCVPVGDSHALATQLRAILNLPRSSIIAKQAVAKDRIAAQFTWEQLATRMLHIFDELKRK